MNRNAEVDKLKNDLYHYIRLVLGMDKLTLNKKRLALKEYKELDKWRNKGIKRTLGYPHID